MEKTWRWFGKNDSITLDMLRQIGVEGIVTALYEVPPGEIWTYEAIIELKNHIERNGLRWSVVESLPVPEEIKFGDESDNFLASLKKDIIIKKEKTINFMDNMQGENLDLKLMKSDLECVLKDLKKYRQYSHRN